MKNIKKIAADLDKKITKLISDNKELGKNAKIAEEILKQCKENKK